MSVITVAATVEASNVPPRIKLVATDTGTPAFVTTTILRNNPDGSQVPVRTATGGGATLTGGTVTVYDYDPPFGQPVTYTSLETPANVTTPVTLDASWVWLIHPGIPSLSIPVDFRAGSFAEETWTASQAVFWPMGRSTPVVIGDGSRKSAQSSMTVALPTLNDLAKLRALLADGSPLFLNVPPSLGLGIDTTYIAPQDVKVRRISTIGTDQNRDVEIPYLVVARPAGGSQSTRTFADLLVYPNLAALKNAYPTFAAVLAGP
jgi:hypothetical protein